MSNPLFAKSTMHVEKKDEPLISGSLVSLKDKLNMGRKSVYVDPKLAKSLSEQNEAQTKKGDKVKNQNKDTTMKTSIKELLKQRIPYFQDYLKEGQLSADNFLQDTTMSVDLSQLYEIESTCFYDSQMKFMPVQMKIGHGASSLKSNRFGYFLQVWDNRGLKAYERKLLHPVTQWAITDRYFIYKTKKSSDDHKEHGFIDGGSSEEEGNKTKGDNIMNDDAETKFFQIVNLEKQAYLTQMSMKIEIPGCTKDFTKITYNKGILYLANDHEIMVINAPFKIYPNNQDTEKNILRVKEKDIMRIRLHEKVHRIWGLAVNPKSEREGYIHVWVEMLDHIIQVLELIVFNVPGIAKGKLDYSVLMDRLKPKKYKGGNKLDPNKQKQEKSVLLQNIEKYSNNKNHQPEHLFLETVEYEKNPIRNSPIQEFHYLYNGEQHHSIALTEHQEIEIYYQGILRDSSGVTAQQAQELNQLWMRKNSVNSTSKILQESTKKKISSFMTHVKPEIAITFTDVWFKCDNKTSYRIPITLANKMSFIHREDAGFPYNEEYYQQEQIKFHCKLYSGYILVSNSLFVSHNTILTQFDLSGRTPSIVRHWQFKNDIITIFRISDDLEKHTVGIIFEDGVIEQVNSDLNSQNKIDTWRLSKVHQQKLKGDKMMQFSTDFSVHKFPLFMSYNSQAIQEMKTFVDRDDSPLKHQNTEFQKNHIFLSTLYNNKLYSLNKKLTDLGERELTVKDNIIPLHQSTNESFFAIHQDNFISIYNLYYDRKEQQVVLCLNYKIKLERQAARQTFTGGAIYKPQILLFTNKDVYRVSINISSKEEQGQDVIKDLNWSGMYFTSDLQYAYVLSQKSEKHNYDSGLKFYNMEYIKYLEDFDDYEDRSYDLVHAKMGVQSQMDFSRRDQRLTYLKSYGSLDVIPCLHLNVIIPLGQDPFEHYLVQKQINDKLIALTNYNSEGIIQVWNVATGQKVYDDREISTVSENQDFRDYELWNCNDRPDLYQHQLYDFALLRKKQPETSANLSQFFSENKLLEEFPKHIKYINRTPIEIRLGKVIEIQDEITIKEHCTFMHPYYMGEFQLLWFNKEVDLMVEQLSMNRVYLYKKGPEVEYKQFLQKGKQNQIVSQKITKWILVKKFLDFPARIGSKTCLDVMSPSFKYYFEIDFHSEGFNIIQTCCGENNEEKQIAKVPIDLMNFKGLIENDRGIMIAKKPRFAFNRCTWITDYLIRMITEEGIEILVEFNPEEAENHKKFKVLNQIPHLNIELHRYFEKHYFHEQDDLNIHQTQLRLESKVNSYKFNQVNLLTLNDVLRENKRQQVEIENSSLDDYTKHEKLKKLKEKFRQNKRYFLMNTLYQVDWSSSAHQKRFIIDLSFSYLNWKLLAEIKSKEQNIKKLHKRRCRSIMCTILPSGNNFMHELYNDLPVLEQFYQFALDRSNPKEINAEFNIPIINNFFGSNAFSLAAGEKLKENQKMFLQVFDDNDMIDEKEEEVCDKTPQNCSDKDCKTHGKAKIEKIDFKMFDLHLKYLKYFGICHHSQELFPYLHICIKKQLPNLLEYLESRKQTTKQSEMYTRGIVDNSEKDFKEMRLVSSTDDYQELITGGKKGNVIDVEISFIDIPLVYQIGTIPFKKYFKAIGNSKQMEIFDLEIVQKQIEYNWDTIREQIIYYQVIPFVCQLVSFNVYVSYFFMEKDDGDGYIGYYTCQIICCVSAFMILQQELYQLKSHKSTFKYLSDPMNIIELGSPLIMMTLFGMQNSGIFKQGNNTEAYANMIGMTSFLMWAKLLTFLRIVEGIGYYIKIIYLITQEIRNFLWVMLITFCMFGDPLVRIDYFNSYYGQDTFIDNVRGNQNLFDGVMYIFSQALGNYDPTSGYYAANLALCLILISTTLNLIIIMNLLIAIVCDCYEEVNAFSKQATWREKACLINENSFLLGKEFFEKKGDPLNYLVYIQKPDIELEDISLEDQRAAAEKQAREETNLKIEKMHEFFDVKMQEMDEKLTQQSQDVTKLINHFYLKQQEESELQDTLRESLNNLQTPFGKTEAIQPYEGADDKAHEEFLKQELQLSDIKAIPQVELERNQSAAVERDLAKNLQSRIKLQFKKKAPSQMLGSGEVGDGFKNGRSTIN